MPCLSLLLLSRDCLVLSIGKSSWKPEDKGFLRLRTEPKGQEVDPNVSVRQMEIGHPLRVCHLMVGRLVPKTFSLFCFLLSAGWGSPRLFSFFQPRLPCLNHGDSAPSFAHDSVSMKMPWTVSRAVGTEKKEHHLHRGHFSRGPNQSDAEICKLLLAWIVHFWSLTCGLMSWFNFNRKFIRMHLL